MHEDGLFYFFHFAFFKKFKPSVSLFFSPRLLCSFTVHADHQCLHPCQPRKCSPCHSGNTPQSPHPVWFPSKICSGKPLTGVPTFISSFSPVASICFHIRENLAWKLTISSLRCELFSQWFLSSRCCQISVMLTRFRFAHWWQSVTKFLQIFSKIKKIRKIHIWQA